MFIQQILGMLPKSLWTVDVINRVYNTVKENNPDLLTWIKSYPTGESALQLMFDHDIGMIPLRGLLNNKRSIAIRSVIESKRVNSDESKAIFNSMEAKRVEKTLPGIESYTTERASKHEISASEDVVLLYKEKVVDISITLSYHQRYRVTIDAYTEAFYYMRIKLDRDRYKETRGTLGYATSFAAKGQQLNHGKLSF